MQFLEQVRQGSWGVWERGIYFVNPEARPRSSIEFYDFAAKRTARVATIEKELFWNGPSLSAAADGRWILYVPTDKTESDLLLVENYP